MTEAVSNYTSVDQTVRLAYNNYFNAPMSFPSEVIDAVVGFFESNGFDTMASNSVAIVLLQESKRSGTDVFEIIDTLRTLNDVQISAVVAQILNLNRQSTSVLGYKQVTEQTAFELRNVRP